MEMARTEQVKKDLVKELMPQLNLFPKKQTEVAEGIMRSNEVTDAKSPLGYCFRGKFRLDTTYDYCSEQGSQIP